MKNYRLEELKEIYINNNQEEVEKRYLEIKDDIRKLKNKYYYEDKRRPKWIEKENKEKLYKIFFLWSYWVIDKIFEWNPSYKTFDYWNLVALTWLKPLEAEKYLIKNNWNLKSSINKIIKDNWEIYFQKIDYKSILMKTKKAENAFNYVTYKENSNKNWYVYKHYLKYYNFNNLINISGEKISKINEILHKIFFLSAAIFALLTILNKYI